MKLKSVRSAFTLVELMVVILIIVILVSLLSSAVMMALGKIPQVQTSTDIAQLTLALQAFSIEYQLSAPPPSSLVLYENINLYTDPNNPNSTVNNPKGPVAQSYYFLISAFGRNLGVSAFPAPPGQKPPPYYVDWNGDGTPGNGPWILEGEQCLVFYISGIPNLQQVAAGLLPQGQGFSLDSRNPATPGGKRRGPYFTFDTTRLVLGSNVNPNLNSFFVYMDAWKAKTSPKPYAYFSTQGIINNYSLTDCAGIGAAPYFIKPGQFSNPITYQIISAGKDGTFGTTGWDPLAGARGPGADDQTNFATSLLVAGAGN